MRLQLYLVRRYLTNRAAVGWGFLYMVFWALMGAFVMSSSMPSNLPIDAYELYTATWFGVLVLMEASAIGTSTMYVLSYHTGTIPYLVRYSRMRAFDYVSALVTAGLAFVVIYGLAILGVTYAFFSYHFKIQMVPEDLPLILGSMVLSGLFFVAFSMFLELLVIKYLGFSPASSQAVNFVPLILGYGFGFAAINLNLGFLVYASPFADIEYLLIKGYYGGPLPIGAIASSPEIVTSANSPTFSEGLGILALMAWIVALLTVSVALFNRVYYRNIYEGKVV